MLASISKQESSRPLKIPRYASALLQALQLTQARSEALASLSDDEWRKLLALSDSSQLTLLLGNRAGGALPEHVRSRIQRNLLDNAHRFAAAKAIARRHCSVV